MYESTNCCPCEKMDLKSYSHCWKGFKYAENVGKLLGTNKGLMNTITKQKDNRGSSKKRHTVLRFKGVNF